MSAEMRSRIAHAVPRDDALALLADPLAREQLAQEAILHFQTDKGVHTLPVTQAQVPAEPRLRPARRISTHKDAPNKVAMHPHQRAGRPLLLAVESMLELAWVRWHEFQPWCQWMLTQPFFITWPIGTRCLWRVPDILIRTTTGWTVCDVKPDDQRIRTPYVLAMMALTRATLQFAGWTYNVAGSLSPQAQANLRLVEFLRPPNPYLQPNLAAARAHRGQTMGAVIASAEGGPAGIATLLHLFAHELDTDLLRPFHLGNQVMWA